MKEKTIEIINNSLVGFYYNNFIFSILLEGSELWKYIDIDIRKNFPVIAPSKLKEVNHDIRDFIGRNVEQFAKNEAITKLENLRLDSAVNVDCVDKTIKLLKLLKD